MNLLPRFLLPCALAVGAAAQNTNENAPAATNRLAFDRDTSIEVSYASFTTAGGNWLRQLYAEGEAGKQARKFYNERYITAFLKGALKVSKDIELGGNPLAAGTYKLTFRIDEDLVWHLVVRNDKDQEVCAIAMNTERDDKRVASRLWIAPIAAPEGKQGTLHIHFGPLTADVAFTVGTKQPAKAPAKTGAGGKG
ncbi:MAG TPA: hypothetical protein VK081_03485 [Planctomycetota bacterium]|nr:hypothetical protein [Planctomycetota bacterium]